MAASDSAAARRWNELARTDATYFIATREGGWDDEQEFYATGRQPVEEALAWVGPGVGRDRCIDIGCGVGRTTVHLAAHFDRVAGVDISAEMIDRARAGELPDNVTLQVGTGRDLAPFADGSADFVCSWLVFQHIAETTVIESYLSDVGRVLAPNGRAVVQFDTRPEEFVNRVYKLLPDVVLPPVHRRYIRRYRRDAGALRRLMTAAGLTIVDERRPATAEHAFLLAESVDATVSG